MVKVKSNTKPAPVKATVKPQKWTTKELNRTVDYLNRGMSVRQVAGKLNRSPASVQSKIYKEGLRG